MAADPADQFCVAEERSGHCAVVDGNFLYVWGGYVVRRAGGHGGAGKERAPSAGSGAPGGAGGGPPAAPQPSAGARGRGAGADWLRRPRAVRMAAGGAEGTAGTALRGRRRSLRSPRSATFSLRGESAISALLLPRLQAPPSRSTCGEGLVEPVRSRPLRSSALRARLPSNLIGRSLWLSFSRV